MTTLTSFGSESTFIPPPLSCGQFHSFAPFPILLCPLQPFRALSPVRPLISAHQLRSVLAGRPESVRKQDHCVLFNSLNCEALQLMIKRIKCHRERNDAANE